MTAGPTVFNPWYVVYMDSPDTGKPEYYRAINDQMGTPVFFSPVKGLALTFHNLRDAERVAEAMKANIRVLVSRENAEEFGHAGS